MRTVTLLVTLILTVQTAFLCADKVDLLKLQKKEKERLAKLKKKKKGKTLSVNNKNLKSLIKSTKGPYSFIEVQGKSKPKLRPDDSTGSDVADGFDEKKTRGYWQGLKRDLENRITRLELVIETNQKELMRLKNIALGADMLSTRLKYEKRFRELNKRVQSDKILLKKFKKELEGLPDKARKAGVPPGWLR